MSSPTREHLLGYLLEALDRTEEEQVKRELERNPALQQELAALRRCLGRLGLEGEPEMFEPPPGLALRTRQYVEAEVMVAPAASLIRGAEERRLFDWRWADWLSAAAVLVIAATLFFPALAHSRFQSQVAMCQNHLRQLGLALHDFSSRDPAGYFPGVAESGNRAVAGVYAPILVGHQLVTDPRTFVCPTSELAGAIQRLQIPSLEALDAAEGPTLVNYHKSMGGDYGYNLGYVKDGKLEAPCNSRRSNYVLLADAPSDTPRGRRTLQHGGYGQNLLYEDGSTRWVVDVDDKAYSTSGAPLDDPFYNRLHKVAAGLDCDDAVVGASSDSPFPVSLVRE